MAQLNAIKVVVCDIEGTTTSISFVKDTLFPYALKHVEAFLKKNWDSESVRNVIQLFNQQSKEDLEAKMDGAVPLADNDKELTEQINSIVENVKWQMSIDRKTNPLKTLQGLIWENGYKSGELKAQVYTDVPKAFELWTSLGTMIYIYSSGSVQAQKQLFENTIHGDLLPKISGHFDTAIGMKQEKESYSKIIKELNYPSNEILFLTDVVNEAKAAKEAGIEVIILNRPGNAPLTEEDKTAFKIVNSFDEILLESGSKRKIEEVTDTEEPPTKIKKIDPEDIDIINKNGETEIKDDEQKTANDKSTEATGHDETRTDKCSVTNVNGGKSVDEETSMEVDDDNQIVDTKIENIASVNQKTETTIHDETAEKVFTNKVIESISTDQMKTAEGITDKIMDSNVVTGNSKDQKEIVASKIDIDIEQNNGNSDCLTTVVDDPIKTNLNVDSVDEDNSSIKITSKDALSNNIHANDGKRSSSNAQEKTNEGCSKSSENIKLNDKSISDQSIGNSDKQTNETNTKVETIIVSKDENLATDVKQNGFDIKSQSEKLKIDQIENNVSVIVDKKENKEAANEIVEKKSENVTNIENGATEEKLEMEIEQNEGIAASKVILDKKNNEEKMITKEDNNEKETTEEDNKEKLSDKGGKDGEIIKPSKTKPDVNEKHQAISDDHTKMDVNSSKEDIGQPSENTVNTSSIQIEQENEIKMNGTTNPIHQVDQKEHDNDAITVPIKVYTSSNNCNDAKTIQKTEISEIVETTSPSSKEKKSRVEITIEQTENQSGQTTQTTTHIVKEISITEQKYSSNMAVDTPNETNDKINDEQIESISANPISITQTNGKQLDNGAEKVESDSDKENELTDNTAGISGKELICDNTTVKKCPEISTKSPATVNAGSVELES